ncbi:MAG: hypothetical protein D3904_15045, partial [Candidatus Electrothrix sp. EH2]|nr:hypothetical protein [Candidatus Electrothrix sp. EH2]
QGEPQPCSARAYAHAPYHWQNFKLIFRQDRNSSIFEELAEQNGISLEDEIQNLMAFVHHYGWLGAAPQNGLGWVEVQGQEDNRTELAPENPVFFAEDIELSAKCFDGLLGTLRGFYHEKQKAAERMIRYYGSNKKWKEQKQEKDKNKRYGDSLVNISKDHPPIGFEVRRWLKQKNFGYQFFDIDTDQKKDCNYFHASHPLAKSPGNKTYRFRLRCCTRPNTPEGGQKKVTLLPSLAQVTPANRLTPYQLIKRACENLYGHAGGINAQQRKIP